MTDSAATWLVRRIVGIHGKRVMVPSVWGKVPASSATEAVSKYLKTINSKEEASHFDAFPERSR